MSKKTVEQDSSDKNTPEEVFTDRQTQFKTWLSSVKEILKSLVSQKTRVGRVVLTSVFLLIILSLGFVFRDQVRSLLPYLGLTKPKTSVSNQQNAFNVKTSTKLIQGNVVALDQDKKEITVYGQVQTGLVLTQVSFNDQTPITEITFDQKTQRQTGSRTISSSDIKANDIVRVTTKKDITGKIAASDVILIEILRPQ